MLLVHGGGQTRYAWKNTGQVLAGEGFTVCAYDQRGHGHSDWIASGAYANGDFGADLVAVAEALSEKDGVPPIAVGASLGGIAALLAMHQTSGQALSAIVLVDVTPRLESEGIERIVGFMRERLEDGFASMEEVADAVADYLPHRERPRDLAGLANNVRRDADGRYRWHWDPVFLTGDRTVASDRHQAVADMEAAARALIVPTLLVRGRQSDLVSEENAKAFLKLVPAARFVDVHDAGHMIAGDRNDAFTAAVAEFLRDITANSGG